jgi:hypothetical protein
LVGLDRLLVSSVKSELLTAAILQRTGSDAGSNVGFLAAAFRMAKPAFTGGGDIVDDTIVLVRADAARNLVQTQRLADPLGDVVVGTRSVA